MAAASLASGKARTTASVSLTGLSPSTNYVMLVGHPTAGSESRAFTTDGFGNATVTFVPQAAGSHTIVVNTVAVASQALSTSLTLSGS